MPDQKRKLAAIMFTDIVGYTVIMGKDSSKAMELVRESVGFQKPLVEKHNGKWIKEMGDGALAQFNTALDAVKCAVEIQRASRADFEADIRIGIHLGDITIENEDVYGDGVNVASRLEVIADPGGIYISDAIEKAIRGQSNVQAKYLGEIKLKNVDYDVRTYALQGVGLPVPNLKENKKLSGRLLAEIQRRGVLRAGVTYVILSLLLILLLPYAKSLIDPPSWSSTVLYTILISGFPIAMYLAWNYERSPEGFVRTNSKQSWQNPYKKSQKKPLTGNLILVVMAIIIAFTYLQPRYLNKSNNTIGSIAETNIRDKSIAVLPFTNMSNDPDQEYFSDGMMEEILNNLVKIPDLKVISRTTAMRYKGSTKSLREIGLELGVASILEGSVRKYENKVRITVQLIDVNTDHHLWSESYDRYFDDIFVIQSEVAQKVASSLQADVQPEVRLRIESQPTSSTEAYNLFLHATAQNRAGERDRAIQLLEEAIIIDPKFATAYAQLGFLKSAYTWARETEVSSSEDAIKIAMPYYEKALDIDPLNEQAHMELALLHLWYQWDFEAAEKEYWILKELNPNYTWGDFLVTSGRFEEAVKDTELGVQINPLSSVIWGEKIISLYFNNQPEKSLKVIEEALVLHQSTNTPMDASRVYLYLGMYDKVVETIQQYLYNVIAPRPLGTLAIAYYHLGELNKTNQLLAEIKQLGETSAAGSPSFYVAMIYTQMGEIDKAFEWLDKAYKDHEVEMYWLKVEPPFESLHSDPRWQIMLDKVGFPD
jgi:TolB-like protein/class 3 adenylate cyclase